MDREERMHAIESVIPSAAQATLRCAVKHAAKKSKGCNVLMNETKRIGAVERSVVRVKRKKSMQRKHKYCGVGTGY